MTYRDMSSRLHSRVSVVLTAAVLTLAVTSAAAQDTTGVGAISGVVVNAAGQPAEGVRVCALDTASCATSDARGAFRIGELRAGAYRLEILPLEGLPFTSDPVDVRAGLDGTVDITLPTVENFQQTVTVTAPAFQAPEEVKNSGFLVEPREILKSAAALQDVSRYVQGLPGVVIGTNDFRNDIIVRGGSPLENLFVVDNVEIPNINAFANFASAGGTVSLLDAELLQDVTFLTGGYPAPYINRTSSVLQVTQREGNRKEFGGWATLGFAGAGAILEGPINSAGRGRDRGWCRRDEASSICSPRTWGSAACRWCIRSTPRPCTTSRPGTASGWSTSRASTRFGWASPTPPTSKRRLPTSTSATTAGAAPRASTGSAPSGRAAWACSASPTPRPRWASR